MAGLESAMRNIGWLGLGYGWVMGWVEARLWPGYGQVMGPPGVPGGEFRSGFGHFGRDFQGQIIDKNEQVVTRPLFL